jgi:hypothetical protein
MKKGTIKDFEFTLSKKQKLEISAHPGSNMTGANTIHGIFNVVEILDSNGKVIATNRKVDEEWQSDEQYVYNGISETFKKGTYTIRVYAYEENDTMTLYIW